MVYFDGQLIMSTYTIGALAEHELHVWRERFKVILIVLL